MTILIIIIIVLFLWVILIRPFNRFSDDLDENIKQSRRD